MSYGLVILLKHATNNTTNRYVIMIIHDILLFLRRIHQYHFVQERAIVIMYLMGI